MLEISDHTTALTHLEVFLSSAGRTTPAHSFLTAEMCFQEKHTTLGYISMSTEKLGVVTYSHPTGFMVMIILEPTEQRRVCKERNIEIKFH